MMMQKRFFLTCFLFFGLIAGTVLAQPRLVIAPDSLNFINPQPAAFGGTVTYTFEVVNVGNLDFSDSIKIDASINGGPTIRLADSSGYFLPAFGGSAPFVVTDSVTAARYGGGVNIVVIWPTSPDLPGLDVDSITDTVFVTPLGIKDGLLDAARIVAYPNPTTGELHFLAKGDLPNIRLTQVLGIDGRILQQFDYMPAYLDLQELSAGAYFVRLQSLTGESALFKVFKE